MRPTDLPYTHNAILKGGNEIEHTNGIWDSVRRVAADSGDIGVDSDRRAAPAARSCMCCPTLCKQRRPPNTIGRLRHFSQAPPNPNRNPPLPRQCLLPRLLRPRRNRPLQQPQLRRNPNSLSQLLPRLRPLSRRLRQRRRPSSIRAGRISATICVQRWLGFRRLREYRAQSECSRM